MTATAVLDLDLTVLERALDRAIDYYPDGDDRRGTLSLQMAYLRDSVAGRDATYLWDLDPMGIAALESLLTGEPHYYTDLNTARAYCDSCDRLKREVVAALDLDSAGLPSLLDFSKLCSALESHASASSRHYIDMLASRSLDDPEAIAHLAPYIEAADTADLEAAEAAEVEARLATEAYEAQVHSVIKAARGSIRMTHELVAYLDAHGYSFERGWRWGRGGAFSRFGVVSVYQDDEQVYSTDWDTCARALPPTTFRRGKPHHLAVLRAVLFTLKHARRAGHPVDLSCFPGEVGELGHLA